MATLQELETALVNADAAGDSNAARILAAEIKSTRLRQSIAQPGSWLDKPVRSQVIDPPNPGAMARVGRGMMDVVDTVRKPFQDDPAQFQKDTDAEIAAYEKGRGPNAGIDLMRMGGQTAITLPVTGATGAVAKAALGARAAGPVARTAVGAIQGAEQGAATWTPEGQSKLKQAGVGAAGGALAPWASDAVSTVASKALQFGKSAAARFAATPEAIVAELEPVLAKQGVKWGSLSDDVRNGMLAQAKKQLMIDGDLSPDALARKVEMDDLMGPNAGPTRGQVMRENPSEWTWERNTQKLPDDISAPLTTRYQAQLQRLNELVDGAKAAIGGRAQNSYQAGQSATEALKQKMADSKTVVDELYGAFRKSGAQGVEVKPQGVASAFGQVAEEYGTEHIPASVRQRLSEFGMIEGEKQTKLFTVQEAEKLRKLIGNNMPRKGSPQDAALTILQRSVDDAVNATADANPEMLKAARASAAARFAMKDSSAGMTAAAEGAEPDRFFAKYVLNGNVNDLQGLKASLTSGVLGGKPTPGMDYEPAGAQAWKDLKAQVLDYAASHARAQGEGTFSGKGFRKALNELGDERMKIIFEPAELADLRKLDRVAYGLTAEPNLAAVNHSNTASTGAQFLRDAQKQVPRLAEMVTKVPFVGKMAAGAWQAGDEMAQNAELRRQVAKALTGEAFSPSAANAKYSELAQLISGRIDPYVTGAATGAATYFTK